MIRRQVVVPVAPERLWEALLTIEPDQLAGCGGRMEWDLRPGRGRPVSGRRRHRQVGGVETIRPASTPLVWWPAKRGRARPRWRASRLAARCPRSATSWNNSTRGPDSRSRSGRSHLLPSPPAPARRLARLTRPRPADTAMAWTAWDGRLVGAWAGLARGRRRLRPFLGTRDTVANQPEPDVDAVFSALADPTRRRLLDQLSAEGPLATELSASYPVTRQAVVERGRPHGSRSTRRAPLRPSTRSAMASSPSRLFGGASAWLADIRKALGPPARRPPAPARRGGPGLRAASPPTLGVSSPLLDRKVRNVLHGSEVAHTPEVPF